MSQGQTIFAALLNFVPKRHFEYLAVTYKVNRYTKSFPAWAHFVCLGFAHLTKQEGLRDLEAALNGNSKQLYHLGVRHRPSRSTMADAAQRRDWRFFEALGTRLISNCSALNGTALPAGMDPITIALCLKLFPWKTHNPCLKSARPGATVDLRGSLPVFAAMSPEQLLEGTHMAAISAQPNTTIVFERGTPDFALLNEWHRKQIQFVIKIQDRSHYAVLNERHIDDNLGVLADQDILVTGKKNSQNFPTSLRRVAFLDPQSDSQTVLLTNIDDLPAQTIAHIYNDREKMASFFAWLHTHMSAKRLLGISQNAVQAQIWISVSMYLITLMAHKSLQLALTLPQLLEVLETQVLNKMTQVTLGKK